jgi:hypothetical protein
MSGGCYVSTFYWTTQAHMVQVYRKRHTNTDPWIDTMK